jgi:protein XagA
MASRGRTCLLLAAKNGSRLGLLLGVGVAASTVEASAGAWTLDAGTGQAILTASASSADAIFDATRGIYPAPRYDKFEFDALFEYGATDWLTLILIPSLQHVDIGTPVDAQRTGLGYTEFGGRVKLFDWDSWVVSAQATLRVPGTSDATNPAAIGYTDPQTDFRGLIGRSFNLGTWPAFFDIQMAQRFRTDGAPDEFHADLTFGVQPAPQWLLLAQSLNVISEGAGTWGFPSYDYYKLQLSAVREITPALSLQLGGFTAYTGRNTIQENGVILGAWFRF